MNFSVCTSVYKNDKPEYIRVALDSMLVHQTVTPNEVVLVQDGPVPYETSKLLLQFKDKYGEKLNIIKLTENKGLGNALKLGVENAKYDIIARMDSDDICTPDRFEKQQAYMEAHPECDIIGGQISEFIGSPERIVAIRRVPCNNSEILKDMQKRCSMNHMTVMFRKEAVLKAGSYQDWFWNEDYYLWIRMILAGCEFANLSDILVNVRTGKDMYARRGGMKYFKSEAKLQMYMYNHNLIGGGYLLTNIAKRLIVQVLLPNRIRGWVFRTFARD